MKVQLQPGRIGPVSARRLEPGQGPEASPDQFVKSERVPPPPLGRLAKVIVGGALSSVVGLVPGLALSGTSTAAARTRSWLGYCRADGPKIVQIGEVALVHPVALISL
jgi:hypothetical protein